MSTKLVCPECGGVLGVAEAGEMPCKCFSKRGGSRPPAAASVAVKDPSDTDTFDAPTNGKSSGGKSKSKSGAPASSGPDTAGVQKMRGAKRCLVCGKDVAGHRRIKDSRGYTCYACAKAERAAEREGKVACKECRKLIRPEGLVAWEGKMICRKCYGDHQETARFRRKISSKHFDLMEKQKLLILTGVFVVLALIVAYSYFFKMRGH